MPASDVYIHITTWTHKDSGCRSFAADHDVRPILQWVGDTAKLLNDDAPEAGHVMQG